MIRLPNTNARGEKYPLWMIGHPMPRFSAHSGLAPLVACLGASYIEVIPLWEKIRARSWRAGDYLRRWGVRQHGSAWSSVVPFWTDKWILRQLPQSDWPYPVHFWWGEFGSPKRGAPYRRKGARVVVSMHCSARRWDSVWLRPDGYACADQVVLTSESQRPFVLQHVQPERVTRIVLGVDTGHFSPPQQRAALHGRLRLLLMGNTERDHEFAAQVARKLPAEKFEWRVRTDSWEGSHYKDIACVTMVPRLSDAAFVGEYHQADVLAMPMLDSAANDAILESMACGTPVMVNRVGGVPEYVASDCNFVLSNDRNVDEWVEKLLWLERNREVAEKMRPATRAWAEKFDWNLIAEQYRAMYRDVLARG